MEEGLGGGCVRDILLHVHLMEHVGPLVVGRLYQALGDRLPELYHYSLTDLRAIGLTERAASIVHAGLQDRRCVDEFKTVAARHGFSWVTRWDAEYPELLGSIYQPPTVVSVWGTLPVRSDYALAIVGSRGADRYARDVIYQCVDQLPVGTLVVSGGARGADTYAHEAALARGLKTISVLGSGLLDLYPRENTKLFNAIVAAGGAVVSTYPFKAPPLPPQFPARNRVIAGLAQGTLVVQAAERSGALGTAAYSLQEGREVGAVPGAITNLLSAGCHGLIAQGAVIIDRPQKVLDLIGLSEDIRAKNTPKEVLNAGSESGDPVLAACREPVSIDELAAITSLDVTTLFTRLGELEISGQVRQMITGQWVAQ